MNYLLHPDLLNTQQFWSPKIWENCWIEKITIWKIGFYNRNSYSRSYKEQKFCWLWNLNLPSRKDLCLKERCISLHAWLQAMKSSYLYLLSSCEMLPFWRTYGAVLWQKVIDKVAKGRINDSLCFRRSLSLVPDKQN